jgi:hypothetical protein
MTVRFPWVRRYPLTVLTACFAASVVTAACVWDIDVINLPLHVSGFARVEPGEVDEIVLSLVVVAGAFWIDRAKVRAQDAARLQIEQLRVVHLTMRTVLDIVNNCLNELQLFRFEAKNALPAECLKVFDETVRATASKLKTLGDLDRFVEKQMPTGPELDFDHERSPGGQRRQI